jgi:hypothetical protein
LEAINGYKINFTGTPCQISEPKTRHKSIRFRNTRNVGKEYVGDCNSKPKRSIHEHFICTTEKRWGAGVFHPIVGGRNRAPFPMRISNIFSQFINKNSQFYSNIKLSCYRVLWLEKGCDSKSIGDIMKTK